MEKIFLVLVFGVGLFLKVSAAAGAESNFALTDTAATNQNLVASNEYDEEDARDAEDIEVEEVIPARRSRTSVTNNINVNQPASDSRSSNSMATSMRESRTASPVAIIPMIGGSGYQGNWYHHIGNNYSLGLALELTVSSVLALELEGDYGKYNISYVNYQHDFNQYSYGGNTKFYLTRGIFQPFVGLGVMGVTYENMTHGPLNPRRYDRTIGVGQLLAGADIALSQSVAIGVRGSYALPLFNRPTVVDNGRYAAPLYEDASAIDSSFYRLMGSIKLSL